MQSTGPRWVPLLLKQTNVHMGIQTEGTILADLLLRKLGVWTRSLTVSVFGAAALYRQPIVETTNAKHSPRLVTWGHFHSTQQRVAKVVASWEDKGCVDLHVPSCALAVPSVPTTASTNEDFVVNGFVLFDVAK